MNYEDSVRVLLSKEGGLEVDDIVDMLNGDGVDVKELRYAISKMLSGGALDLTRDGMIVIRGG